MLLILRPGVKALCWLLLSLCVLTGADVYSNPLSLTDPARQALDQLNNGQLLEAYSALKKLRAESPDAPSTLFLFAMAKFQIMSLADYKNADREELIAAIEHLEQLCEAQMEKDDDSLFLFSAVQGLRAQLTGMEGDWWATAKLGKKMKQNAENLIKRNPNYYEGYYLVGSYNYFADALPGYLKFFRALAFIPGGNRTQGMKELIRAYENPNVASVEAGRTLAVIYTYFEDRPDYGIRMCDNVLNRCPDAYQFGLYKGINLYFSSEFSKAQEWLSHTDAEIQAYSRLHEAKKDEVIPLYLRLDREVRYWIARSLLRKQDLDEAERILLELKTPELHQPFWIQRGVYLSLAEIYYRRRKPDAAEPLIAKILQWEDVKDSHEKAKLLKKKKADIGPFEIDFK